jgi:hypothetical protein
MVTIRYLQWDCTFTAIYWAVLEIMQFAVTKSQKLEPLLTNLPLGTAI